MGIGEWIGTISGITAIISFISFISYKLIRSELRDEFFPMIAKLSEKIDDDGKKSRNYMGQAFQEKLNNYEEHNEEKRILRSEKYMQTIVMIQDSIKQNAKDQAKTNEAIIKGLDSIKAQITENSYKIKDHDQRINKVESKSL